MAAFQPLLRFRLLKKRPPAQTRLSDKRQVEPLQWTPVSIVVWPVLRASSHRPALHAPPFSAAATMPVLRHRRLLPLFEIESQGHRPENRHTRTCPVRRSLLSV